MPIWNKLAEYDTLNVFTYLGDFWCIPEELTAPELYKADMIVGFTDGQPHILKNRYGSHNV